MKTSDFIREATEIHNGRYKYIIDTDTVYAKENIIAICPIHGAFKTNVYEHLRHKRGCRKCADIQKGINSRSTTDDFIYKAKKLHGDKYDYSKVKYETNHTKICIICPEHGEFWMTPNAHLRGSGCPKCAKEMASKKIAYTTEEFIERAREKHGNKYDYSKVEYKNRHTPVTIICPIHGEIYVTPANHLRGCGCPKCRYNNMSKSQSLTTNEFIELAKQIHDDKYDYSKVEYNGYQNYVTIICPIHGEFKQTPDSHLHGSGCSKCGVTSSKGETEILHLLQEKLGTDNVEERVRNILDRQEIDIYIPLKKIGIEYNGLIWHSNKYKKETNYHLLKTEKCKEKGVDLIQIFEDEYINHKNIVLTKLLHIIGLDNNKPKIAGRKCLIQEINNNEAKEFLDTNHIQGFVRATIYLGAFYNNTLIGVMSFMRERKNKNNWELVRFASHNNYICQGIGGKLFKYFINQYNPEYIKSFADRRWTINEDDNLYIKLGFIKKGYVKPTYWYICNKFEKYKRYHKFNFRKNILHKKYGFPLDLTEDEMTKKLGLYKIWDCGLIKYIWYKNN